MEAKRLIGFGFYLDNGTDNYCTVTGADDSGKLRLWYQNADESGWHEATIEMEEFLKLPLRLCYVPRIEEREEKKISYNLMDLEPLEYAEFISDMYDEREELRQLGEELGMDLFNLIMGTVLKQTYNR